MLKLYIYIYKFFFFNQWIKSLLESSADLIQSQRISMTLGTLKLSIWMKYTV